MLDRQRVDDLERGEISGDSFHHTDHVRMAFAYLTLYPALEALEKFSTALKRFAMENGKPDRYSQTVTFAYFFLIRERMAMLGLEDWDAFSLQNPDLLNWQGGALSHLYRTETLQSKLAKEIFLLPDLNRQARRDNITG